MSGYIGGEFGRGPLVAQINTLKPDEHIRYVMSGRTAMHLIIQNILATQNIHNILMPSYCSRSMIEPIASCGISIKFYKVFLSDKGISLNYPFENNYDGIVLMDYFGYCSDEIFKIAKCEKQKGKCVIIDKTQSFLCNQNYEEFADYTIVSFRKWVPTNVAQAYSHKGFLIPQSQKINVLYETLRSQIFEAKYLGNQCDDLIEKCDELLKNDYKGYCCSKTELAYFNFIDFQAISNRRRSNAQYLTEKLSKLEIPQVSLINKNIKKNDCPLYVPVIVKPPFDREFIRLVLLNKGIECYIHWKLSPYHDSSYCDNNLYTSELSLFCDQRYTNDDMDFIVSSIAEIK